MEGVPDNGDICLVLADGRPEEQRIFLPARVFIIGRNPDCHLCLASPLVSRRHCAIAPHFRGLTIRDLRSRNGTLVNGQRVKSQTLRDGDEVTIGQVQFLVRIPGATAFRLASPEGTIRIDAQAERVDLCRATDIFDVQELELNRSGRRVRHRAGSAPQEDATGARPPRKEGLAG